MPIFPDTSSVDFSSFHKNVNYTHHLNIGDQVEHTDYTTYFDNQLLFYDSEALTRWKAFKFWKGTILADNTLWTKLGIMLLICAFCAGVSEMRYGPLIVEIDTKYMDEILLQMNSLCAFLLGFYLQEVINRWWSVRVNSVDSFQQACTSLHQLICVTLGPSEEETRVKSLIMRYSLLCHQFVFHQRCLSSRNAEKQLGELKKIGLVTDEESLLLQRQEHKSQIIWVWMTSLFHCLIWKKQMIPKDLIKNVHGELYRGRCAIQRGETYVNTQVPLPYVHLNAITVHVFHILLSGIAGINMCVGLHTSDYGRVALAMSQIWAFGVLYQSILIIAAVLSNPLGKHEHNFSKLAYHVNLQEAMESYILASNVEHQEFFWPRAEENSEGKNNSEGKCRVTTIPLKK